MTWTERGRAGVSRREAAEGSRQRLGVFDESSLQRCRFPWEEYVIIELVES